MVSISTSAASFGSKMMEGRVKGLLLGSESVCIMYLSACNCAAISEAMVGGENFDVLYIYMRLCMENKRFSKKRKNRPCL